MIVIIGAGISGITIGKYLLENNKTDFLILEKENYCGGLATQYYSDGYWFDFGGHYFHFKDKPEIKEYLWKHSHFKEFVRKSKTFMFNQFIPFPVQLHLSHLPLPWRQVIYEEIISKRVIKEDNLSNYLVAHFGNTLYQLFFNPFLSKYYRMDLSNLAGRMDRGSIPVPNKEEVTAGFHGKKFEKTGYNPTFYSPKPSLRHFIQKYSQSIKDKIHFSHEVKEVEYKKKYVQTNGGRFFYNTLINTMPLKELIQMTHPHDSLPHHRELQHISTLVVNIVLSNRRKRFHWAYLPSPRIPFYRMGYYPVNPFPVCYLERSFIPGETIDKETLYKEIVFTLKKLGVIESKSDIIYYDPRMIPISYILFTLNWRNTVPPLLKKLESMGIYSIGRYGTWNYSSMSDDIQTALKCAQTILSK